MWEDERAMSEFEKMKKEMKEKRNGPPISFSCQ